MPPGAPAEREVHRALRDADRMGMTVMTWLAEGYPAGLRQLCDPPPVLFCRGRTELLDGPGVAIVGSRRSTARGREAAERIARALVEAGICVNSGLALGIDGAAHRGALSRAGGTVAVMGRGADRPYPPTHAGLFRQIVARGLVLSEFLPGTLPLPHHFPRRNRILAALSVAVVVVEAGERKSGALITTDHALDLGRDVWAVPGPIDTDIVRGAATDCSRREREPLVDIADFVDAVVSELGPGIRVRGLQARRWTVSTRSRSCPRCEPRLPAAGSWCPRSSTARLGHRRAGESRSICLAPSALLNAAHRSWSFKARCGACRVCASGVAAW